MSAFADTNFFTNIWTNLAHSDEAHDLFGGLLERNGHLPVTRLLRMEITNSLNRLVFETRNGSQIIRVTPEAAMAAKGQFDDDLEKGDFLQWAMISEMELEEVFNMLSARHTAKHGFRTYDILHVASALLLGCDTFWSFDAKVKQLARLEGLQTN